MKKPLKPRIKSASKTLVAPINPPARKSSFVNRKCTHRLTPANIGCPHPLAGKNVPLKYAPTGGLQFESFYIAFGRSSVQFAIFPLEIVGRTVHSLASRDNHFSQFLKIFGATSSSDLAIGELAQILLKNK